MANVAGDGFEFLSDPIDRFPLPDLAAAEFFLRGEANQSLGCAVAQSSNGAVWDGAVIAQEEFESGSKRIANIEFRALDSKGDGQAADSANRFRLPDLTTSKSLLDGKAMQTLVCADAESSIGDVGDGEATIQGDVNSTCSGMALSMPTSEQSTGKDNPQAPSWIKRISALEKTLQRYAEKKTDTVVVPATGINFDSLGEAYDCYNLYS